MTSFEVCPRGSLLLQCMRIADCATKIIIAGWKPRAACKQTKTERTEEFRFSSILMACRLQIANGADINFKIIPMKSRVISSGTKIRSEVRFLS